MQTTKSLANILAKLPDLLLLLEDEDGNFYEADFPILRYLPKEGDEFITIALNLTAFHSAPKLIEKLDASELTKP